MRTVVLVCEGPSDPPFILRLMTNALGSAPLVQSRGFDPGTAFTRKADLDRHSAPMQPKGGRVFGAAFRGKSVHVYATLMHKILVRAAGSLSAGDMLVVVLDADRDHGRHPTLVAVRDRSDRAGTTVVGVPVEEIEAWALAGFVSGNRDEQNRIDALARRGRHPVRDSHTWGSGTDGDWRTDPRTAKGVLKHLCDNDNDRAVACMETDVATLRNHGVRNGLTDFLDDIDRRRAVLAP